MKAGSLRHRIVIQQSTPGKDSFGEKVEAWSDYASRWASIEPLQGSEQFRANQQYAEATTFFRIRHGSGVTVQMRVVWKGRIYKIHGIQDPEERNREFVIYASEIV